MIEITDERGDKYLVRKCDDQRVPGCVVLEHWPKMDNGEHVPEPFEIHIHPSVSDAVGVAISEVSP